MDDTLPPPSAEWAYFLDLDGTLVDLTETPDEVVVSSHVRQMLFDLHTACEGAVALVSGRSLNTLDGLMELEFFPMAGQHGLEWRNLDEAFRFAGAVPTIKEVANRLAPLQSQFPRLLLELKGASVAIHYRRAPFLEEMLCHTVNELLKEHAGRIACPERQVCVGDQADRLRQRPGHLRPNAAAPVHSRTPVFIGDDLTDESGFAAVNTLGGLSIKVGNGETQARHRFQTVQATLSWLTKLSGK